MASAKAVWGIDVGRCALKAIKLRAGAEGKIELLACDFIEHAKILSQPDANRGELIAAALEKFLSKNDLSKDTVYVSVPGQHTLARFTKLPPVAAKKIPDIVRYEADQQIPFDMDEVIWDYQLFQQEGLPDVEVGIFAMKRELVREHLLHFEQAAIEPMGVQSGPLAVYNAAHFDGLLSDQTTVLLDVGAENTDLVIGTQNGLWTRTIPIGGNSVTDALVKSFKLSFSKAEELKREAATHKHARQIFTAMRPTFADLVQELQRSIGFYSATHRDAALTKVICVGNGFQMPGLQKYLEQNLGYTVVRPTEFAKATPSGVTNGDVLRDQFSSFFVAYGLALQGLDQAKVTSNLLPTETAKQVVWRKKRPAFAATAAAILIAGAMVWVRPTMDLRALAASGQGSAQTFDVKKDFAKAVQAASAVIENGASGESDRAKAQTVFNAGAALKEAVKSLRTQGQPERVETEQLIELSKHKTIIPRILETLFESVPVPQPEGLAKATTPAEVREALRGAPPRNQRKQLVIDMLDMQFEPNLNDYDWQTQIDVPAAVNVYKLGGAAVPGIRIVVEGRTPNKEGAAFLRDEFIKRVVQAGRKPGRGFFVDNSAFVSGSKVDVNKLATGGTSIGRGVGARGAARPPTPVPGKTPGSDAPVVATIAPEKVDVVTLEPMEDDLEFVIWFSVILKDAPADAAVEDEG